MTAALRDRPQELPPLVIPQYVHHDPCHVGGREWDVLGFVEKYDDEERVEGWRREGKLLVPDEVTFTKGNLLVNAGIQRLEDQLIGVTTAPYNNTNCRLGVGDTSTAAVATDTDLGAAAGSTHRQFVVMDSTYPSRSGQVITFRATFTSGLANFAWAEWGIDIGTANGTTVTTPLLNHKIASLGTKVSGAQWVFTVTVTIS